MIKSAFLCYLAKYYTTMYSILTNFRSVYYKISTTKYFRHVTGIMSRTISLQLCYSCETHFTTQESIFVLSILLSWSISSLLQHLTASNHLHHPCLPSSTVEPMLIVISTKYRRIKHLKISQVILRSQRVCNTY